MPRQRNPNREKAYQIWLEHNGNITNRQIAEMLGENEKVVAVWKQRDKWNVVQQSRESCTTKKRGAPKGNKNAVGNRGGPGGPPGNDKAVTHGFFRRIFPDDEETMAIIGEIGVKSPLDILWENIVIQYTAIARAQKIMFVQDREDETKTLKRMKDSDMASEREWEIQHAWDKQANYLQAQARAMSELRGLIKDFLQLSGEDDKRRLELEKMRQSIRIDQEKLEISKEKLALEKTKVLGDEGETEDDGFIDALNGHVREVWNDDGSEKA